MSHLPLTLSEIFLLLLSFHYLFVIYSALKSICIFNIHIHQNSIWSTLYYVICTCQFQHYFSVILHSFNKWMQCDRMFLFRDSNTHVRYQFFNFTPIKCNHKWSKSFSHLAIVYYGAKIHHFDEENKRKTRWKSDFKSCNVVKF